uniref:Uncharacterized protein n=1 Tax=Arundo donax TaxID=35708 RepID=A0A0A9F4K3_ARUDO
MSSTSTPTGGTGRSGSRAVTSPDSPGLRRRRRRRSSDHWAGQFGACWVLTR